MMNTPEIGRMEYRNLKGMRMTEETLVAFAVSFQPP